MLSVAERRQRQALGGRIGGYLRAAMYDGREVTQKARETFLSRFEREVDPNGTLSPTERQRRAEAARKAHFARLALKSAQKRAKKVRAT